MLDLKACAVCFSMDGKLINMDEPPDSQLRFDYNTISGLHTYPTNGMLVYLCVECCRHIQRFIEFQRRCQRAYFALKAILFNNKINVTDIEELKKGYDVASPLSYIDLNRIHYEEVQYSDNTNNQINTPIEQIGLIPVYQYNIGGENENITSNAINNQNVQHTTKVNTLNLADFNLKCQVVNNVPNRDIFDPGTSNVNDPILHNFNLELANASNDQYQGAFNQDQPIIIIDDVEAFHVDDLSHLFDSPTNDCPESDSEPPEDYEPPEAAMIDPETMSQKNEDGILLVEEYAILRRLTMEEAQAAMEVRFMMSIGSHQCKVCTRKFVTEKALEDHFRRHGKHTSGLFLCEICKFYFQTDNLLKTHMIDKHMYKYICRKCPEINFDRVSAKTHFYNTHVKNKTTQNTAVEENTPDLPCNRVITRKKKRKAKKKAKPVNKQIRHLPKEYIEYSPQTHEEQYQIVLQRQYTKNYIDAPYKCNFCFKGFRTPITYRNHMRKHDPAISGKLECDVCKQYYRTYAEMYKHMVNMHKYKYACKRCDFVHVNKIRTTEHYLLHMNRTYKCTHCGKVYKKMSSLTSHIRYRHPSTVLCNICGHSYVSQFGLYFHLKRTHSKEETEKAAAIVINPEDPLYCSDCTTQFLNKEAFDVHLNSSSKHVIRNAALNFGKYKQSECNEFGSSLPKKERKYNRERITTPCGVCDKILNSDVELNKHYKQEHPGESCPKRYICEICGYAARQHVSLTTHMYKHKIGTPFKCQYCDKSFSSSFILNNHILIHTGEKPNECSICNRRFRQKITLKLHVRTVHMKIPYPPWDKKNRRRRAEAQAQRQLEAAETLQ